MIDAVVFDLDGVLIDSEPLWERVRREVVAEYGGHWRPEAEGRLMGMSTAEWTRCLSEDLGADRSPGQVADLVIERMAQCYARQVPLLPGAAAVRRLAERWPLGLASSSPRRLIDTVLDLPWRATASAVEPRRAPRSSGGEDGNAATTATCPLWSRPVSVSSGPHATGRPGTLVATSGVVRATARHVPSSHSTRRLHAVRGVVCVARVCSGQSRQAAARRLTTGQLRVHPADASVTALP
jgi:Haloacid dehalogenase-like hydrolase